MRDARTYADCVRRGDGQGGGAGPDGAAAGGGADAARRRRARRGLRGPARTGRGRVYGSRVVLLVGSGDDGGDALYAGARLARRGAGVTAVLLAPERAHAAGLAALRRAGGRTVEITDAGTEAGADGVLRVVGLLVALACADEPGHPSIEAQLTRFREMVAYAEQQGVDPEVRHIANSAAILTLPDSHFDLVRAGVATYGVSPSPEIGVPADFGLRQVMTLTASLALVKHVPGGHGVSYGHHYVTPGATTLGLVPLGYADGVPRHASAAGPVLIEGKLRAVAGRIAMDQFVVDLGGEEPPPGTEVVLFGPGDRGEPTVEDWAQAAGTIGYEIVTRIGSRVPRVHVNGVTA
ncbi:Alanine racemase [Streptomyces hirsutus]